MKDFKTINELKIYRGVKFAGILSRTEFGCTFTFDESFLKDPEFQSLAFKMPKGNIPFKIDGVNLHPFFANLLPEGMRLKAILSNLKTSPDDLFSLFAAVSSNTIGDVYAKAEVDSKNSFETPKLKNIDFSEYFKKITGFNSYASGEDAIAGVQEKLSASMISFPLNIAKSDKSYILKLNPKDKPNLVENEFYSMALAKKCKIQIAKVKIVRDKNKKSGLLVERFDRIQMGQKTHFLHQEDLCQVLGIYASEKYRVSFSDLIKGVKPFVTAESASSLKMIKLYCFSYLLGNGDLHAKNISLLVQPSGLIDLSPAYDLLCSFIYGDHNMAVKFDGKDNNIKFKQVTEFAERFGVKKVLVEKMLLSLVKDFSKNYLILKNIKMTKKTWDALEKTIQKRIKDLSN